MKIARTFSLEYDILEKLKKLSDKTKIPQVRLLEEALEDYFKKKGK